MSDLREGSYSPPAFPERSSELERDEGWRERLGFGWLSIGLGLVVSAVVLALLVRPLRAEAGAALGAAAILGGLAVQRAVRRRRRTLLLVLRGPVLAIYREGERVDVAPIVDVQHLGLYAGHVVTWTLVPLFAAVLCGVAVATANGPGQIVGGVWALVGLAIAASNVFARGLCLHFFVPVERVRRRVLLAKRDGEALLAAHPKTGGWRVTE